MRACRSSLGRHHDLIAADGLVLYPLGGARRAIRSCCLRAGPRGAGSTTRSRPVVSSAPGRRHSHRADLRHRRDVPCVRDRRDAAAVHRLTTAPQGSLGDRERACAVPSVPACPCDGPPRPTRWSSSGSRTCCPPPSRRRSGAGCPRASTHRASRRSPRPPWAATSRARTSHTPSAWTPAPWTRRSAHGPPVQASPPTYSPKARPRAEPGTPEPRSLPALLPRRPSSTCGAPAASRRVRAARSPSRSSPCWRRCSPPWSWCAGGRRRWRRRRRWSRPASRYRAARPSSTGWPRGRRRRRRPGAPARARAPARRAAASTTRCGRQAEPCGPATWRWSTWHGSWSTASRCWSGSTRADASAGPAAGDARRAGRWTSTPRRSSSSTRCPGSGRCWRSGSSTGAAEHGRFGSVDQLREVSGIGEAIYARPRRPGARVRAARSRCRTSPRTCAWCCRRVAAWLVAWQVARLPPRPVLLAGLLLAVTGAGLLRRAGRGPPDDRRGGAAVRGGGCGRDGRAGRGAGRPARCPRWRRGRAAVAVVGVLTDDPRLARPVPGRPPMAVVRLRAERLEAAAARTRCGHRCWCCRPTRAGCGCCRRSGCARRAGCVRRSPATTWRRCWPGRGAVEVLAPPSRVQRVAGHLRAGLREAVAPLPDDARRAAARAWSSATPAGCRPTCATTSPPSGSRT